jgi:hypothetical protein
VDVSGGDGGRDEIGEGLWVVDVVLATGADE